MCDEDEFQVKAFYALFTFEGEGIILLLIHVYYIYRNNQTTFTSYYTYLFSKSLIFFSRSYSLIYLPIKLYATSLNPIHKSTWSQRTPVSSNQRRICHQLIFLRNLAVLMNCHHRPSQLDTPCHNGTGTRTGQLSFISSYCLYLVKVTNHQCLYE